MTPSPSRPSAKFFWSVIIGFVAFTAIVPVSSRAVNISNTWILPEEGFPVFYRYFRDRISWYEADAVCQFHHANLVTVDTTAQYDATRAYLKELDIVNNVWIGLIRSQPDGLFTWTERREYRPLTHDGYWDEQISQSSSPLCAAMDPAADFRWHSHHCGGPEVASFICELPVPTWASQQDGCMLTSLPSLTVLYLPEQAAVELTSDCGLGGTKSIVCKGKADRDDMIRQLSCGISPEDFDEKGVSKSPNGATGTTETDSVSSSSFDIGGDVTSNSILTESTKPWLSSNTVDTDSYDVPTRHRRETEHTDLPATLAVHTSSTTMGSVDTTRPSFDKTSNVPSDEPNRTGEEKTWSSTRPPVKITDGFVISDPVEDEIQRDRLNSFGEIDNADPEIMQKLDSNVKQNIVSSPDRVEIPQMDQVVESIDTTSATPINNLHSSDSSNVSNVPSNLNNVPSTLQSNHETAMAAAVSAVSAVDSSSSPDMTDSFTPNSDQLQRYANSAPEFPSAINQGQLFGSGGENGTHFYIDLNDTMADGSNAGSETSAVSVSTVSSVTNTVVTTSQGGRVESERRAKNEMNKSPVHSFPAVTTMSDTIRELERSTESSPVGDNVKLVELDTDYTATKKKNATGKFLELDDSFTIGDQENDHKIIEINIIDQKSKGAIPAKLIITTKANKRPTTNTKRHVFTSSVKKDGENLKMQNVESVRPVKITAFNETFTEFSNDTQDIVVIDPKLVDLNTNTTKILVVNNNSEPVPIETIGIPTKVVVVPEKIREQELAAQRSQEDNIKKDFLPAPLRQMPDSTALNDIEDKRDSNEEETRPDDEMKEGSVEFNSEIPPRPNRGRLLTRSPHRSYYPYFFSRVLG